MRTIVHIPGMDTAIGLVHSSYVVYTSVICICYLLIVQTLKSSSEINFTQVLDKLEEKNNKTGFSSITGERNSKNANCYSYCDLCKWPLTRFLSLPNCLLSFLSGLC